MQGWFFSPFSQCFPKFFAVQTLCLGSRAFRKKGFPLSSVFGLPSFLLVIWSVSSMRLNSSWHRLGPSWFWNLLLFWGCSRPWGRNRLGLPNAQFLSLVNVFWVCLTCDSQCCAASSPSISFFFALWEPSLVLRKLCIPIASLLLGSFLAIDFKLDFA